MTVYDRPTPVYVEEKQGIPHREHKMAIETHGISPLHRRTFRGVREFLE